ncbi:hypothetical protein [Nitrobacter winogradskyi]|nr:hypothetical protein [Nitrobacter winogradskyi]MCP1998855.1 hypothetical protein [Nitrobacter winogradskyi]
MPASLAAGYCGESTVDAFLKRVGKEYPLPRVKGLRGFMTAKVEDLKIKLNDAVEQGKMLLAAKNHWMDRALCAEQERENVFRVVEDTARELGCDPDKEAIVSAIARLKQERDEAYERLKPFAKINPVEIAFSKSEKMFRIDYDAAFQDQLAFRHFRAARDIIRQLTSGPEKEEK